MDWKSPNCRRSLTLRRTRAEPALVQEEAGIHVGISADLPEAARHAAEIFHQKYQYWLSKGRFSAWGRYKRQHFTVAVGGGNTLKAQYQALVQEHHADIEWFKHVRIFLLEESSGEKSWESAENSLVINLIMPLAEKLLGTRGIRRIADDLGLQAPVDMDDIIDHMISAMVNPINLAESKKALDNNNRALATRLARREAERYQRDIQNRLTAPWVLLRPILPNWKSPNPAQSCSSRLRAHCVSPSTGAS
jgi:hypothetical protein